MRTAILFSSFMISSGLGFIPSEAVVDFLTYLTMAFMIMDSSEFVKNIFK